MKLSSAQTKALQAIKDSTTPCEPVRWGMAPKHVLTGLKVRGLVTLEFHLTTWHTRGGRPHYHGEVGASITEQGLKALSG